MRPTRRGWVVLAAIVGAFAEAVAFGPRGLNAIVAPGVVAFVAAAWQLHRLAPPAVDRTLPSRGEAGAVVTARLAVESDVPQSARVVESVGGSTVLDRSLTVGRTTAEFAVPLDARGALAVGPTTVVVRDVLGLLRRTFEYSETDEILVHPAVEPPPAPAREALAAVSDGIGSNRQAAVGIRRYRRGDPLRDVHWRKSATQVDGELVVKRFSSDRGSRPVAVVAEATPAGVEAMARATASVVVALLDAGVPVALATPSGQVASGDGGRPVLLDHLALATAGQVDDETRAAADVRVEADADGARLRVAGREVDLSGPAPAPPEGVAA